VQHIKDLLLHIGDLLIHLLIHFAYFQAQFLFNLTKFPISFFVTEQIAPNFHYTKGVANLSQIRPSISFSFFFHSFLIARHLPQYLFESAVSRREGALFNYKSSRTPGWYHLKDKRLTIITVIEKNDE
jgi:hypothetical protein